MKNVIGSPASGKDYFDRPNITDRIWEALKNKSNVLISSPRRVGKTSVLFHMVETAESSFHPLYIITQSISTKNDFFKRLYNSLLAGASIRTGLKMSKRTKEMLLTAISKVKKVKLGKVGVEFNAFTTPDYFDEFVDLLEHIELDGATLVIMVDEITQTIENIIKKEGDAEAISFLEVLRELRQSEAVRHKVLFIYTGSIGLEGIMDRLGYADLVNDLQSIKFPPLSRKEARRFIRKLLEDTSNLGRPMGDSEIEYLLDRIEWLIVHYIKIAVEAIKCIAEDQELDIITTSSIDDALDSLLGHRNYFEHWKTRLKKTFKKKDLAFATALLTHAAENNAITTAEIVNLARKAGTTETYKEILSCLAYDGYINNDMDRACYCFNSPILKAWWCKYVAN